MERKVIDCFYVDGLEIGVQRVDYGTWSSYSVYVAENGEFIALKSYRGYKCAMNCFHRLDSDSAINKFIALNK